MLIQVTTFRFKFAISTMCNVNCMQRSFISGILLVASIRHKENYICGTLAYITDKILIALSNMDKRIKENGKKNTWKNVQFFYFEYF